MRKILFCIALMFIFSCLCFAEDEYKMITELSGGVNFIAMTDYNDDVDEARQSFDNMGAYPELNNLGAAGLINLSIISIFKTSVGIGGIYSKFDYLIVVDNTSKVLFPDNIHTYMTEKIDLSVEYIGIGYRQYSAKTWIPEGHMFGEVDFGLGIPISNQSSLYAYDLDGMQVASAKIDFSGILLGTTCTLGADYWFNDSFGLNAKMGYRFMKGTLSGTALYTGFLAGSDPNGDQTVDYSGFYLNAGISFSFSDVRPGEVVSDSPDLPVDEYDGPPMDEEVSNNPEDLPILPEKSNYKTLVNQGNDEYANGNYAEALGYYEQAAQIAETAEVYKKIGTCNYNLKNVAKAIKAYEKSIELNPDDVKLKKWLKEYKAK